MEEQHESSKKLDDRPRSNSLPSTWATLTHDVRCNQRAKNEEEWLRTNSAGDNYLHHKSLRYRTAESQDPIRVINAPYSSQNDLGRPLAALKSTSAEFAVDLRAHFGSISDRFKRTRIYSLYRLKSRSALPCAMRALSTAVGRLFQDDAVPAPSFCRSRRAWPNRLLCCYHRYVEWPCVCEPRRPAAGAQDRAP